jgi:hypothetical protein
LLIHETNDEQWNDDHVDGQLISMHGLAVTPIPLSTMLVVDRSGSMDGSAGENSKIHEAKRAARLYTELLHEESDWLGVTRYNDVAETLEHLDAIRNNRVSINELWEVTNTQLTPDGGTSIGGGIQTAAIEFESNPEGNAMTMIVLTDGKENSDPRVEEVIPNVTSTYENLQIYCVGLGRAIETGPTGHEGIQSDKLEYIANETDAFYNIFETLAGDAYYDLNAFYFKVFADARDRDIIIDPTYWIVPLSEMQEIARVNIAECDREFDFLIMGDMLAHPELKLLIQLEDPTGQIINPTSTVGGVAVQIKEWGDARLIRIKFPPRSESDSYRGVWKLLMQPYIVEETIATHSAIKDISHIPAMAIKEVKGFRLAFLAAVGSDYRMDASVTEARISINQPIHLSAKLTEAWWPAPNGAVIVEITKPNGSVVLRDLYDDGQGHRRYGTG